MRGAPKKKKKTVHLFRSVCLTGPSIGAHTMPDKSRLKMIVSNPSLFCRYKMYLTLQSIPTLYCVHQNIVADLDCRLEIDGKHAYTHAHIVHIKRSDSFTRPCGTERQRKRDRPWLCWGSCRGCGAPCRRQVGTGSPVWMCPKQPCFLGPTCPPCAGPS